jgi:glycosyltransferase involved in cell wall biosynthesis
MTTGGTSETTWPSVAVILPTRGRPDLVRASIQAIVDQTYAGPIECIVIHDQEEPDAQLESLGRGNHTVAVTTNRQTPGLAGSRNTGLGMVDSDFIATCDDDDVWHATKLSRQMQRMLGEPDLLAIGAGIRLLFANGDVVDWSGDRATITHDDLVRSRRKELHSSTLLMRREAFDVAGWYDEDLPNSYAEDYEFLLRVSRHGSIGVINEPLADIRKGEHSWFTERASGTAEALEYLLRRHPELTSDRRGHARVLGQISFARAAHGQRAEARKWAARALRIHPLVPHAGLAAVYSVVPLDPKWALKGAQAVGRGIL